MILKSAFRIASDTKNKSVRDAKKGDLTRRLRVGAGALALLVMAIGAEVLVTPARAEPEGELLPGMNFVSAPLVAPNLAQAAAEQRSNAIQQQIEEGASRSIENITGSEASSPQMRSMAGAGLSQTGLGPGQYVPSIPELARALRDDPDLIFEYVYNNIDYVPMWGLQKGGEGALLDGSGTAFDIAQLTVELLREAGYDAAYVVGTMRLQETDVEAWLNISPNYPVAAASLVGNGGMPGSYSTTGSNTLDSLDLGHVWVRVNIGGTNYYFDPSFKRYTHHDPIDIATASGYSHNNLMVEARDGATITTNYLQDINRDGVRGMLDDYAMNLVDYIRQNHAAADVVDVIGGRELITIDGPVRNTSIPNQAPGSSTEVFTGDLPAGYRTTVRVKVGNPSSPYIDELFYSDEIYAHRLTLRVNSSMQPSLVLDGTTLDSGSALTAGAEEQVTFVIDHPYPYSSNTYCDQTRTQTFTIGSEYTHLIVTGFGNMARGAVEKYRNTLLQGKMDGLAAGAEPMVGSGMGMLAATWLAQNSRASQIQDVLHGNITVQHHMVGLAGYEGSPYIDLKAVVLSIANRESDDAKKKSGLATYGGVASAIEGTSVTQTQGVEGLSTVQLIDIAAEIGGANQRLYNATTSNYVGTVKPALVNYSAGELATVESYINAGYRVLLPKEGNLGIGDFEGIGFIGISSDELGYAYIIGGGLKGAKGIESITVTAAAPNWFDSNEGVDMNGGVNYSEPTVNDPIGMLSGDFILNVEDLSIGSGPTPFGLTFARSYTSGARRSDGPLGYGWAHSFDITATEGSDGYQGMGEDSAVDAAAAVIAMYTSLDLLTGTRDLDELVVAAIVQRWLADKVTHNVATVSQPGNNEQFVKLADGTYNPPPASPAQLSVQTDGSYQYRFKDGTLLDFDTAGNVETSNDPNGNTLTFSYASSKLTGVANEFGRSLTISYTGEKISGVSDSEGRSVSFQYDDGNLVTFEDAAGEDTVYEYDQPGRLTKIYYPDRPSLPYVTNTYDTLGRVKTQANANNDVFEYFFAGTRSEEEDSLGNSETQYFDRYGRQVLRMDRMSFTTHTEYDGQGRVTKKILPAGDTVEFGYDARHNLTQVTTNPRPCSPLPCTNPPSKSESFTFHTTFNKVLTATDVMGKVTNYTYSSSGNLEEIKLPAPVTGGARPTSTFTYNGAGQMLTSTDPTGIVTRLTYDAGSGDLLSTTADYGTGRLNLVTEYDYDDVGNRTHVTDPKDNETVSAYDDMRRVSEVTGPTPSSLKTQVDYDEVGRVVEMRSETGLSAAPWQVTTTTYTPTGKVATQTTPQGHTTTTTYDDLDRVDEVTDPEGRKLKYVYDANGRVLVVKRGVGTALAQDHQTNEYDENDLLLSIEDAEGNRTEYEYDPFDRLKRVYYPSKTTDGQVNTADYEEFTYDAADRMLSLRNRANELVEFDYDNLGRNIERSAPGSATVTATYDLAGRALTKTGSDGQSISYDYDTVGRLEDAELKHGSSSPVRTVAYEYDQNGNRTRLGWPDGYYVTYEYDELNRLTKIKENGASDLANYAYDKLSRRVSVTLANGAQTTYSYEPDNDLSQLNHSVGTGLDVQYGYNRDNTGLIEQAGVSDTNLAWTPASAVNSSYSINGLNQYTAVASNSITYDSKGNLTAYNFGSGAHAYAFNALNQLTSADIGADDISYSYDPIDRRSAKTVNGTTTDYISDGIEEIAEYDRAANSLLRRYVYGPGVDERIVLIAANGDREYYQTDHQGSTIATSDASGVIVDTYRYDPWGFSTDGLSGNPFRYTGRRLDEETGLYHYRARYYSPQLGRFLQTDPLGYQGGMNLYAYVLNNPVNATDPSGEIAPQVAGAIIGGALEAVSVAFDPKVDLLSWEAAGKIGVAAGVGFLTAGASTWVQAANVTSKTLRVVAVGTVAAPVAGMGTVGKAWVEGKPVDPKEVAIDMAAAVIVSGASILDPAKALAYDVAGAVVSEVAKNSTKKEAKAANKAAKEAEKQKSQNFKNPPPSGIKNAAPSVSTGKKGK